jgi:hypothetical protein
MLIDHDLDLDFTLSGMNPLAYQHRRPVSLLIPMIFGRIFVPKTTLQNTKLKSLP